MAAQLRRSWERTKLWPAGEYTLLADSHAAEDRATYSKGDTLALNQWEATRLGTGGAIAPPTSMRAVRARTESGKGTARDEYLYRMWELAGAWEKRGTTKALHRLLRADAPSPWRQRPHISRMFCSVWLPPALTGTM